MKAKSDPSVMPPIHCCDRCARRSPTLLFDDAGGRRLCPDCHEKVERLKLIRRPRVLSRG